jgi:putative tricarboxylic transport membrane protein
LVLRRRHAARRQGLLCPGGAHAGAGSPWPISTDGARRLNEEVVPIMPHRFFLSPARRRWTGAMLAAALAALAAPVASEGWTPTRPVEIVVPSAPGGSNDKTARTVERILNEKRLVPAPITIVNKPGGGNALTMNYLVQHSGDGHYLMIGTPTILTNHIIGRSKLTYTDFTPVASLLNDYIAFAVNADSSVKSGKDLSERLKKDPKAVSVGFATALGSHNHIAAGLFMKAIGADVRAMRAIAFKGSAEAITAVLGGHVDLVTTASGNAATHVANGKMRVLAICADKRMEGVLADVPTWKELGVPLVFGGWRSIMGPKAMPAEQVAFWENALKQVVAAPEFQKDLERNFWSADFATGERMQQDLKKEYEAMKSVLVDLGLAK